MGSFDGTFSNAPPAWFTGDSWTQYQKCPSLLTTDSSGIHHNDSVEQLDKPIPKFHAGNLSLSLEDAFQIAFLLKQDLSVV